jgi:hypothetical protein
MTPEVEAALTTPIVAAAAVGALVLLLAAWPAVGALLTVAHEAGHVAVGVLTGHRVLFFEVANEDAGRRAPIRTTCTATRSSRGCCGRRGSSPSRSSACGRAPS